MQRSSMMEQQQQPSSAAACVVRLVDVQQGVYMCALGMHRGHVCALLDVLLLVPVLHARASVAAVVLQSWARRPWELGHATAAAAPRVREGEGEREDVVSRVATSHGRVSPSHVRVVCHHATVPKTYATSTCRCNSSCSEREALVRTRTVLLPNVCKDMYASQTLERASGTPPRAAGVAKRCTLASSAESKHTRKLMVCRMRIAIAALHAYVRLVSSR